MLLEDGGRADLQSLQLQLPDMEEPDYIELRTPRRSPPAAATPSGLRGSTITPGLNSLDQGTLEAQGRTRRRTTSARGAPAAAPKQTGTAKGGPGMTPARTGRAGNGVVLYTHDQIYYSKLLFVIMMDAPVNKEGKLKDEAAGKVDICAV